MTPKADPANNTPQDTVNEACLMTGLTNLDHFYPYGLEPGIHLIVGSPASGKTSLLYAIMDHMAAKGVPQVRMNCDMLQECIDRRRISAKSGVPLGLFGDHEYMGAETKGRLTKVWDEIKKWPVTWTKFHLFEDIDMTGAKVASVDPLQKMPNRHWSDINSTSVLEQIGLEARNRNIPLLVAAWSARGNQDPSFLKSYDCRRHVASVIRIEKYERMLDYKTRKLFVTVQKESKARMFTQLWMAENLTKVLDHDPRGES